MFIKSYSLFNNLIVFLTPTSHTAPGSAFKKLSVGNMALGCAGGISPLLGRQGKDLAISALSGPLANLARA